MFSFLNSNPLSTQTTSSATPEPPSQQRPVVLVSSSDDDDSMNGEEASTESRRLVGQVKFFNDITLYGFIRRLDTGEDVFVHLSDLKPKTSNRPTLYTGEYVTFSLGANGIDKDGSPRHKAVEVRGIQEGSLMCDHGEITFRSYSRVGFGQQPSQ